ncbi:MAG: CDP-alcohol phosphatidyltransferase family protein [Anaerolineaceae bacterium]|nr:CDP-alcohol phosphatidyltransferase family protein [Anaerolineaceae bacterium]
MDKVSLQLRALRREWFWLAVVFAGMLVLGGWTLAPLTSAQGMWTWLATAGVLMGYQLAHLRMHLKDNLPLGEEGGLFPSLGAANWVTMLRAGLLALLAGFAFAPRPAGWVIWLPGGLYIAAALMDFLDGYLARITRRSSRLGEILDMHWDGFGMLAACWLLVRYDQTQAWFLVIGLARYLFLAGMRIREWLGRPNYPLPPSMIRRAMAGAQMGLVAALLLPVFGPPVTHAAAVVFSAPFLLGFTRDWFYVSGVLPQPGREQRKFSNWQERLPLALRMLLWALLVAAVGDHILFGHSQPVVLVVLVAGLAAVGAGAAGRAAALGMAILSGFILRANPGAVLYWAILFAGIGLFLAGTGRYSLWKPEDWLIYHRPGETHPAAR